MTRTRAFAAAGAALAGTILAFLLLAGGPSVPEAALLAAAWLAFGHGRSWRWRAPSTLLLACILGGAAFAVAAAWLDLLPGAALREGLAAALSLLAGHGVSAAAGLLAPSRPLRIAASRRTRFRLERALRRTPWAPHRLTEDPAAPLCRLPDPPVHDYRAAVPLPGGGFPLHREGPAEGMGAAVKRCLDILLALALLPAVAPAVLLLALAVRLRSRGPAFHIQERVTRNGALFRIVKLRSMVPDAEPGGAAVWPVEGDPRITPLGHVLRRYWLDELPQILNVLAGSLSWVGPRPERPSFVQEFGCRWPNYPLRHQVKAGITGLAQVHGFTGNTSIHRRLVCDLRYARRWSAGLDLWLIFLTAFRLTRKPRHAASRRETEQFHIPGHAQPLPPGDQRCPSPERAGGDGDRSSYSSG